MARSLKSIVDESDAAPSKPRRAGRATLKSEKPESETPDKNAGKLPDDDFLKTAIERADEAYQRDKDNIAEAYEDLDFLAGNQWPEWARKKRLAKNRPMLTFPILGQFVRQVSGDMRMMKPAIKATPADGQAKAVIADLISGMIRYIENRSEARIAYALGGDSQVSCGSGAWRVTTEYAEETTFNQEIRIVQIDDPVSILWDTDSILPTREDADWCIVPVDMSHRKFKKLYPDVPVSDFENYDRRFQAYWFDRDRIRVGEYWERRPAKRKLALLKDGSVQDLTGKDDAEIAALKASGNVDRIEDKDGHKVFRSLITLTDVLEEPKEWAGRYIPIIPVIGDEIRIGRKIVRRGLVRLAKDGQRLFNFVRTTQAEIAALAPKAPFIGTDKNFEEYEEEWAKANEEDYPYLRYTPDPKNGNLAPQRSQHALGSPGMSELGANAVQDIKAVLGIYDAGLGNRSNETSGVAIKARQNESDVGSVGYTDNFALAIRHTGRVVVDLIPHVYDTERSVGIVHEDGTPGNVTINKGMASPYLADEDDDDEAAVGEGTTPEPMEGADNSGLDMDEDDEGDVAVQNNKAAQILNDVTVGAYGIVIEMGPSYSTRREKAADDIAGFIKNAPQIAPLILDLYARAQDWPQAQEIADRIVMTLPPPIQAMIAEKKNHVGEIPPGPAPGSPMPPPGMAPPMPPGPPPPPPPNPAEMAEMQSKMMTAKSTVDRAQIDLSIKEIDRQIKLLDLEIARAKAAQAHSPAESINFKDLPPEAQAQMADQAGIHMGGAVHPHVAVLQGIAATLAHHRGMIDELASQSGTPAPSDNSTDTAAAPAAE